jgi:hypothetical protein
MHSKIFLWVFAILITTAAISMSSNVMYVHAANINCAGNVGTCHGTNESDNMIGNDDANVVCGRDGNDNIDLKGNGDAGHGSGGNDIINGGFGNDGIVGDYTNGCSFGSVGADKLIGGPGDDVLGHGSSSSSGLIALSDGHRDYIDCGPGNDRATINTSVDGDIVVNCEIVTSG